VRTQGGLEHPQRGRLAGDLCVSSHKSTNVSAGAGFEPYSWLCAEIRLGERVIATSERMDT
jgi:hypothetical protein